MNLHDPTKLNDSIVKFPELKKKILSLFNGNNTLPYGIIPKLANEFGMSIRQIESYVKKLRKSPDYKPDFPKNLSGQRFGKLSVIRFSGRDADHKYLLWECRCDCGNIRIVRGISLRRMHTTSCRDCIKKDRPTMIGSKNTRWTGFGEISGGSWAELKWAANNRGHEFTIDIQYVWDLFLKQERRCKISGILLTFNRKPKLHTASLDRIDSSKGYIRDNVQWVHKYVNWMKRDWDQAYFLSLISKIYHHSIKSVIRFDEERAQTSKKQ